MAANERRRRWELESLLEAVLVDGMVVVSRFKVPTLLGRTRERGEIWQELLDLYEDIGGDPSQLRGKRVGDRLLLTRFGLDDNPYDSASCEVIEPGKLG
jgi:hypothetical protein